MFGTVLTRMLQINQEILNDTDIVSVVLDVISSKKQLPSVIAACYKFIHAISKHNPVVQNRLFHDIDKILHCRAGHECHGWENAMADAVGEIFHDNKEVSVHIKPHHIKMMVDILAERGAQITGIMHALRLVQSHSLSLSIDD